MFSYSVLLRLLINAVSDLNIRPQSDRRTGDPPRTTDLVGAG